MIAVLQSKIGRKLEILALAGIGLKLSHFGHGYGYKTCLKRFKSVIIGISDPKNPMLAVLQSKIGHGSPETEKLTARKNKTQPLLLQQWDFQDETLPK